MTIMMVDSISCCTVRVVPLLLLLLPFIFLVLLLSIHELLFSPLARTTHSLISVALFIVKWAQLTLTVFCLVCIFSCLPFLQLLSFPPRGTHVQMFAVVYRHFLVFLFSVINSLNYSLPRSLFFKFPCSQYTVVSAKKKQNTNGCRLRGKRFNEL